MILTLLAKVILSCIVAVLVMLIIEAVYTEKTKKAAPDWFKALGGLAVVIGFVSLVIGTFIAIWS